MAKVINEVPNLFAEAKKRGFEVYLLTVMVALLGYGLWTVINKYSDATTSMTKVMQEQIEASKLLRETIKESSRDARAREEKIMENLNEIKTNQVIIINQTK
ncbi:hypothetical protein V6R21_19885 [Limibacter armeniacum]|uniref:hypothetical protein n=1 Tax=Limibacter armeniacum TaxID=466084 RepID=UPI002FE5A451